MMKKECLALFGTLGVVVSLSAQNNVNGTLTGSLESNNIYYVKDSKLNGSKATNPDDHFGSNSYLKLDYMRGKFSAGLQLEAFLPALQGYDYLLYGGGKRTMLGSKYIQWEDNAFSFRAGNIYEQFGTGLIFRSYEDRTLGFNNSLEGVTGRFSYRNYFAVKAMYGRPRLYLGYAESSIRGGNLNVSLADIIGWSSAVLNLEGSYVNRYENLMDTSDFIDRLSTNSLDMYSVGVNCNWKGIDTRMEYITKSKDLPEATAKDMVSGMAIFAELGYSKTGFSALASYRKLINMNTMLTLRGQGSGNVLNYIPALTRQYTYMLANLNPYQVNPDDEEGGQGDVYYTWRPLSNKRNYWKMHANVSVYYSVSKHTGKRHLLWRDVNFDVEHNWNKSLKTIALVSVQEWSPTHGTDDVTFASNIFVLDNIYKFNRKTSLRLELQYLYSVDYEKDWMAGLVEFSFAPKWSISASDMYNHGSTKIHYYNASVSYSANRTRIQIGYGRNRAGYVCSSGVCRYSPAYTGANLTVTSSF